MVEPSLLVPCISRHACLPFTRWSAMFIMYCSVDYHNNYFRQHNVKCAVSTCISAQAIQRMKQEVADADPGKEIHVEFLPLDLSSLQSTVDFAHSLVEKRISIHILVLNAGVANLPFGTECPLIKRRKQL